MVKRTFTLLFLLLGSLEAKKKSKASLNEVLVYSVIGGSCLLGGLRLLNRARNGTNQKKQTKKRKAKKVMPTPPSYNKRRSSVDLESPRSVQAGTYTNSMGVEVPIGTTFGTKNPADISLSESDDDDGHGAGDGTIGSANTLQSHNSTHSQVTAELVNSFSSLSDQLNKPFGLELQTSNDITEIPPVGQEEVDALEERINRLSERVEALGSQDLGKEDGDEDEQVSPTGSVVIHDGAEEKQGGVTQTTPPPPNVPPVIGGGVGEWEEYEPSQYQKVGDIMDKVLDLEASKAKQGRDDDEEVNSMREKLAEVQNNEAERRRRAKMPHIKVYVPATTNIDMVQPDTTSDESDEKEEDTSDTASATSSSGAPIKIIQSYSGVASLNPNSPEAKAATEKFYGKKNNRLKVVGGRPGKSKKTKKNKPNGSKNKSKKYGKYNRR